jgi:hypothetical protein
VILSKSKMSFRVFPTGTGVLLVTGYWIGAWPVVVEVSREGA